MTNPKFTPSLFENLIWTKESLTFIQAGQLWKYREWEVLRESSLPPLIYVPTNVTPLPFPTNPIP